MLQIPSLSGYPYNEGDSTIFRIFWSLFPPNLFSESLGMLKEAAPGGGISWSKRSECLQQSFFDSKTTCVVTMVTVCSKFT